MPLSEVNDEFRNTRIAFGKGGQPLGDRDDIDDLAIIALESGNKRLLRLFKRLPELSELKRQRVERQLTAKNLRANN